MIDDEDLYGPVWMIVTYTIVLALASNLDSYFSLAKNHAPFVFSTALITAALALNLLFRLVEIFTYPAVMNCLDGELSNKEVL